MTFSQEICQNFRENLSTKKKLQFWAILAYFDAARRAVSEHFWDLEKRFEIKKFLKKWYIFKKNTPPKKNMIICLIKTRENRFVPKSPPGDYL